LLLELLLFAIATVVKVWITNTWRNNIVELIVGFGGTIAFMFPYEFSSWQGYQGGGEK
jgi:hypothetical protein